MEKFQKSKKAKYKKVSIDLPTQKTWKQLEEFGVATLKKKKRSKGCKKVKKIGRLLDKAFELLLEKLTRQN